MAERFGAIEFDQFHREQLPRLLARVDGGQLFGPGSRLRPLAFCLRDGRAYTYIPHGDGLRIEPGADLADTVAETDAGTIVVLSPEDWCDFVWELRTVFALLYADRVEIRRGSFGQLARWEPALRAVFDGQAVYDLADPPPLLDGDGRPLELGRSFTLRDSDVELRDFLERAGFLHLKGVFTAAEIDRMRVDAKRAVARARPDDQRSWWTTVDGRDVCSRVNYLNEQSEFIAGLGSDPRLRRIGDLGGADQRDAADRLDGHAVVVKVPGATTGLADLPWHRDCGMGGHPVKCPLVNVGIQLDAATAGAGQLQVIAGSHRGTSRLPAGEEVGRLPTVALTTEAGDVTVHFGHTLHAAPPPTDRHATGRRALYVTYVPPLTFEMVGPGQGYNDVLFTRDSGHVRHVDEFTR
jgi:hypothetical protein